MGAKAMRVIHLLLFTLIGLAAFPLPAGGQEEETRTTRGLYPLIYRQQEGDRSEFGILGPLIQFRQEPGKSYTAFLPFFSVERDEPLKLLDVYALWPLIRYRQQRDEVQFRLPPLIWHSHNPISGWTVGFPLYWRFWEIEQKDGAPRRRWWETFIPFYWNIGSNPGNRYFHIWPLYGHHEKRDHYDSYHALYPFFNYFQDRKKGEVGLDFPWPIAGYRRGPASSLFYVVPLVYLERSSKESKTMVTPLLGHIADERSSTTWLFPLWGTHRTERYRLSAFLANLLVVQTSRKSKELSFLWPLTSFRVDGKKKSMRIAPLIWGKASPEGHSFLFLPLVYSRSTRMASDLLIFPLFYNQRRGSGESPRGMTVLAPLYWDFRGRSSRLTMLIPFLGSSATGEDFTRFILPTIFHKKEGNRSYFHAWPLYGHHQVGDHYDRYFFLAPFFSYTSDRKKDEWKLNLLWPFFSYRKGKDSESLRFLPFAWFDRTLKGKSTVIFPFYWRGEDGDTSYLYTPFYGEQRRGETFRRHIFLGGAYVRTRDDERKLERHDALYYLFTRKREGEKTLTAVRPLFWHESSPKMSRTILVPFFYRQVEKGRRLFLSLPYSGGAVDGKSRWDNVLGFLYHRRQVGERTRQDLLFPLVHWASGPDASKLEIRPLLWHSREGEKGHTLLFPFYYHEWGPGRKALTLFPFYTRIDRTDGSSLTSVLGPLYISRRTRGSLRQDFLWPFGYHYKDGGVEKWQVRPFFWYENLAGREQRTILFPVYWRHRSDRRSYLHVWPFFGTEEWADGGREYRRVSTAYPLFSYAWDRGGDFRRLDLLFPIFRTQVDQGSAMTWLFPLLFYKRQRLGIETETDLNILPPLFHYGSAGESARWSLLWKLVTYDRVEEDVDFRLLFELIRVRKRANSSLFRIFPLISTETEAGPEGSTHRLSLLWPLFNYRSDPEGVRLNILHYFIRYENTRDRWLFELNPLFSVETTPNSWYFSVLGGLFSLEGRPSGTEMGLFYFISI